MADEIEGKVSVLNDLNPRDIDLRLKSSRKTIELGEPSEILLYICNNTKRPIWLTNLTTTLTLPAEIIHPSESDVASRGTQLPTVVGKGYDSVCILPEGRYICTWRLNQDAKELKANAERWEIARWLLFFHPGKYKIQANIHVWTDQPNMTAISEPKKLDSEERRRDEAIIKQLLINQQTSKSSEENQISKQESSGESSEKKSEYLDRRAQAKVKQAGEMNKSLTLTVDGTVDVTIRSSSQFTASAFGGLLAFVFRELYWLGQGTNIRWLDLALLPSYVLMAILISLFLYRVTEARFPFTIKIMDFWGATAFGVLASFVGNGILSKLIGLIP